ncbi:MAG: glycerol-3-phosphate dehydrogenase/oxidase [Anaerolineae bacterium]|nr:glycerol-3-phosphate dehydrogenase/oxidase [Anaerolineae bacterium]
MQRQEIIATFEQNPHVDVLIIGGGINGIGTFLDLALQGASVLIVDKADFCSGASAASSRLVHGGLRYLEHGSFGLVRESLLERNRLFVNAPHAVKPLPFTIPIFTRFSGLLNAPLKFVRLLKRPSERGWLVVKLGMIFYDWFTRGFRVTPTHRMLSRDEALKKHPALNPAILGAAYYYDGIMPYAERIGLELVLDAEASSEQAHALNYVSLTGVKRETVTLRDELSGAAFEVKPRVVVNAAGAWIDLVNGALRHKTRYIGGTKGSHIVVRHPELWRTLDSGALYFENKDGRMCIMLPLGDKVIVGATDLRIDDPDEAICSDEEIDYFLHFTGHILPGIALDRSQIVFHFSGVRPLVSTDEEFTGLVTREHCVQVLEPDAEHAFPVYSLVGGKWTTFRSFAEETTDRTLAFLGRTRRINTQEVAIGGGKAYPRGEKEQAAWLARLQAQTELALPRLQTLFERYGTRAEAVARYIAAGADAPLDDAPDYSERELLFLAEHEKVAHLDDLLLRRTLLAMLGMVTGGVLRQAGQIMGAAHGWSAEQIEAEIERTVGILVKRHGVREERLRAG